MDLNIALFSAGWCLVKPRLPRMYYNDGKKVKVVVVLILHQWQNLFQDDRHIELHGRLVVVGLEASDEVRVALRDGGQQLLQGLVEPGCHCRSPGLHGDELAVGSVQGLRGLVKVSKVKEHLGYQLVLEDKANRVKQILDLFTVYRQTRLICPIFAGFIWLWDTCPTSKTESFFKALRFIWKFFVGFVVLVYLVSSWRGMVSLARACLESLDTIALK